MNEALVGRRAFLGSMASGVVGAAAPAPPNIVLILADDMGFSDLGCYGGEIRTPNLNRVASEGVRFTQFQNTARCCPSRASLMTGLYAHQAGVGFMEADWGIPSYQGHLKRDCVTLPEVLRGRGYRTVMSGKWHLGTAAPDVPWARGFDHVYGIPEGGGVYFWPTTLKRTVIRFDRDQGAKAVETEPGADFYSTDAFASHAVEQIHRSAEQRQPFFLYVPFVAPHFPQQAWEKDVSRYLGRYKDGWRKLREARYERQLTQDIIPANAKLSPCDGLEWDALSGAQKEQMDRQMSVYAAQVDCMDQNIGRILGALRDSGTESNTLFVFLSDNGAQKNSPLGDEQNPKAVFGSRESFGKYAQGWANLCNTPYRRYKEEEHLGGNATPLIVKWPEQIRAKGAICRQAGHIIDLVPTLLHAAGLRPQEMRGDGRRQALEGESLVSYFDPKAPQKARTFFWEHGGNRAVREGDWKLVATKEGVWSLYNLKDDPTELRDRAAEEPGRVQRLTGLYAAWARRCGVLTLKEIQQRRAAPR